MSTELLYKYISGNANQVEKRLVTEWLSESEEHLREYMALRKLYDISLWQSEPVVRNEEKMIYSRKAFWTRFVEVAIAASVILVVCFHWWGNGNQVNGLQTVYVPAGQRAELTLADGTKVWLNSQSELIFPASFDGDYREVKLNGEGYFDVVKDEKQPFIVETNKFDIKVLGTEFNVCAYKDESHWETALLEGKIEVLPLGERTEGVLLEPDMRLSWKDGKMIKRRIQSDDYYRWREGLICFTDISLEKLFEKLERYYEVDFVINNEKIMKNHYTGKFRTCDGIEHVLNVLRLNNNFVYEREDESNVITIN